MDIQVLGTGCHDCLRLELLVGQLLAELKVDANFRRMDDPHQIGRYAPARLPGLIINGELVSEGRVPTREEIRDWLVSARDWEQRMATQQESVVRAGVG